jgi:tRNA nucleotidyltransferase (CCA-adding enzyme)
MDIVELIPSLRPIVAAVDELEGRHGRTFLVGGAVRDAIIGAEVIDLDFAIEGAGIDFARDLAATLGGSATPYGDFGTATVAFAQGSFDVASTRSELYASQGVLPTVEPAGIDEDLLRRDFTMNAMAVALDSVERGALLDPLDGEADIASGTVRVIHDASFADDPTRLVRAARYEARFTFSLDSHSEALARSSVTAGYVSKLSATRVGSELSILSREETGLAGFARLDGLGVARAFHPSLDFAPAAIADMKSAEALNEQLGAGARAWRLRLAVATRTFEPTERLRWLNSLQLARHDVDVIDRAAGSALELNARCVAAVSSFDLHQALICEPLEAVVMALAAADTTDSGREKLGSFLTTLRHVSLTVTGDDLAKLGLAESPAVGRVLNRLRQMKLDGEFTTVADELEAARELIRSGELN